MFLRELKLFFGEGFFPFSGERCGVACYGEEGQDDIALKV